MKKGLVVLGLVSILLVGCNSEEKKMVLQEKESFQLLYNYEEDKVRPIVEEEKTPEELVEEIVLEGLGIETDTTKYKDAGVLKGQGIFIESAVREGSKIPNVSAVPISEREAWNSDKYLEEKYAREGYARIMLQREKMLEKQYAEDTNEKARLIAELQKRLDGQEGEGTEEGKENWDAEDKYEQDKIDELKGKELEKQKEEIRTIKEKGLMEFENRYNAKALKAKSEKEKRERASKATE